MSKSATPQEWRLVEVWGDTTDTRHLAWSIVIGIGVSITAFLLANRWMTGHVSSPELARAYAMLAGLAGCLFSGVICAILFPPKRKVVEGEAGNDIWRDEVLAKLAEQHGGLGSLDDLPPSVIQEMKELQLYELFASYKSDKGVTEKETVQEVIPISPNTETQS